MRLTIIPDETVDGGAAVLRELSQRLLGHKSESAPRNFGGNQVRPAKSKPQQEARQVES